MSLVTAVMKGAMGHDKALELLEHLVAYGVKVADDPGTPPDMRSAVAFATRKIVDLVLEIEDRAGTRDATDATMAKIYEGLILEIVLELQAGRRTCTFHPEGCGGHREVITCVLNVELTSRIIQSVHYPKAYAAACANLQRRRAHA